MTLLRSNACSLSIDATTRYARAQLRSAILPTKNSRKCSLTGVVYRWLRGPAVTFTEQQCTTVINYRQGAMFDWLSQIVNKVVCLFNAHLKLLGPELSALKAGPSMPAVYSARARSRTGGYGRKRTGGLLDRASRHSAGRRHRFPSAKSTHSITPPITRTRLCE